MHELETMAFNAIGSKFLGGVDWKHLTRDLMAIERKLDQIGWFADFNYSDATTTKAKPEHLYSVIFMIPNSSMIAPSDIPGEESIFGMSILVANSRVVHTELYGMGDAERPQEFLGVRIDDVVQEW